MNARIEKLQAERDKILLNIEKAEKNLKKWKARLPEVEKEIKRLENEECLEFLSQKAITLEKLISVFGSAEPTEEGDD